MLRIPLSGCAVFSPTSERFLVAERGSMRDDFTVSSYLRIYTPNFAEVAMTASLEAPLALRSAAWSEGDDIAVSAENGCFLLTDGSLSRYQTVYACEGEITCLSFSYRIPSILLAVGTQRGEILFFEQEKLLFSTKNKNGENPHAAQVTCIAWNARVPRICASADTAGRVIVWDQKKKAAIGTFEAHAPVTACAFSYLVATCVIIACDDGRILLWDMRKGQDAIEIRGRPEKPAVFEFIEGYDDHFALRYNDGVYHIYKVSAGTSIEKLGSATSNITTCSVFYPNFALHVTQSEVVCKFVARHCYELAPVVYNPQILAGLPENEPEIIEFTGISVITEGDNQVVYLKGAANLQENKYIRDVQSVVGLVEQCLETRVELQGLPQYFAGQLTKPKEQLISAYFLDVPKTDKINLKGSEAAAEVVQQEARHSDEPDADIDFFDADYEVEHDSASQYAQDAQQEMQSSCTQHRFTEQVLNYVYNGDIASAINFLLNSGELLAGLMFAITMGQQVDETLRFVRGSNECWSDVFDVLDTVRGATALDLSRFDTRKWRQGLRLLNSFDQGKLPEFVRRVLSEQKLTAEQQIDFNLYAGNAYQALNLAWGDAPLAQRMQLAMLCAKNGVAVQSADLAGFRDTAELLRSQGEHQLASRFEQAVGCAGVAQAKVSPQPLQYTGRPRAQRYADFPPPAQYYQPQAAQPPNKQAFQMPYPPMLPQPQSYPQVFQPAINAPQPARAGADFFSVNQAISPNERNNVVYATDLLAQARPQAPESQPMQFLQPQPPVIAEQAAPLNLEQPYLFMPTYPSQSFIPAPPSQKYVPPPPVAPPAPAAATVIANNSPPTSIPAENAYPRQILDKTIPGLMAIDQINCNGNRAAQQLLQALRDYYSIDLLNFNKNWVKIAECAIWIADDDGTLLSATAKACLTQFADLIAQHKGAAALTLLRTCMQEHPREFDRELSRWNGALRILSGAFK